MKTGPSTPLGRVEAARRLESQPTRVVKVTGRDVRGTFGRREFEIRPTLRRAAGVRARRTRFCPRNGVELWGPAERVADYLLRGSDRKL